MSDNRVQDDFWYLYEASPSLGALRYRIRAWFYERKVRRQTKVWQKEQEECLRRAKEDRAKHMATFKNVVDGAKATKEAQDLLLARLQPRYVRDDLPEHSRQLPDLPLPKE